VHDPRVISAEIDDPHQASPWSCVDEAVD
jgi:hypothetical protein